VKGALTRSECKRQHSLSFVCFTALAVAACRDLHADSAFYASVSVEAAAAASGASAAAAFAAFAAAAGVAAAASSSAAGCRLESCRSAASTADDDADNDDDDDEVDAAVRRLPHTGSHCSLAASRL
jgi:hypothetical protein